MRLSAGRQTHPRTLWTWIASWRSHLKTGRGSLSSASSIRFEMSGTLRSCFHCLQLGIHRSSTGMSCILLLVLESAAGCQATASEWFWELWPSVLASSPWSHHQSLVAQLVSFPQWIASHPQRCLLPFAAQKSVLGSILGHSCTDQVPRGSSPPSLPETGQQKPTSRDLADRPLLKLPQVSLLSKSG